MKRKNTVLVPGSFDPVTVGHEDIIRRACLLGDTVYVTVLINPRKTYLFPLEKRVEWLKKVCRKYPSVTVESFDGMLYEYAKAKGVTLIAKGIRNERDFAYEREMALFNDEKAGTVTVFLPAGEAFSKVSSTEVREALQRTGAARDLPSEIAEEATSFFQGKKY